MVMIKSHNELELMRKSNRVVAEVREELKKKVKPGVTTKELDSFAEDLMRKRGAKPAFKGYRGFPASICTSINQQVVHGIPGDTRLKEGDVIGLDIGVVVDGYFGDTAVTCPVGHVTSKALELLKITEESLYRGIDAAKPGGRLHDIGAAVQTHVEGHGFSIVREFVGHGIGLSLHEDPQVPNYGTKGTGMTLKAGMVLAIEPMVNLGKPDVKILSDGWTAVTVDGKLSAHFEHTVAITENGPEILTVLQ